jgi:hypothetical protein
MAIIVLEGNDRETQGGHAGKGYLMFRIDRLSMELEPPLRALRSGLFRR